MGRVFLKSVNLTDSQTESSGCRFLTEREQDSATNTEIISYLEDPWFVLNVPLKILHDERFCSISLVAPIKSPGNIDPRRLARLNLELEIKNMSAQLLRSEEANINDPLVQLELKNKRFEDEIKNQDEIIEPFAAVNTKIIRWGSGFTERTNVSPAVPQYGSHYHPHVPSELGYYDLTAPEVMVRQAELANIFGLGGFCFYFYWFSGARLLETPILNYLEHGEIKFPFCLFWANETRSRTWDGKNDDLLLAQHHSPEDDIAFINYLSKYISDNRCICVDGKSLIMVY